VALMDSDTDPDNDGRDSVTLGDIDTLDVKLLLSETVGDILIVAVVVEESETVREILRVTEIVGELLSEAVSLSVGVLVASDGDTVAVTVLEADTEGGSVEGDGQVSKNLAGPAKSLPQKFVWGMLAPRM
jgi:hypothetical protein